MLRVTLILGMLIAATLTLTAFLPSENCANATPQPALTESELLQLEKEINAFDPKKAAEPEPPIEAFDTSVPADEPEEVVEEKPVASSAKASSASSSAYRRFVLFPRLHDGNAMGSAFKADGRFAGRPIARAGVATWRVFKALVGVNRRQARRAMGAGLFQ